MRFGYLRVSTKDQNVDRQIDLLREECDEVFIDRMSGRKRKRPELERMMDKLRADDQIVVVRLARFGRSTKDLLELASTILDTGATLRSQKEGFCLDGSPMGKMLYTIMGALAEFERDLLRERTKAGMKAAKRRGKHLGRPLALTAEQVAFARRAVAAGDETLSGMASLLGVHRNTLKRALQHQ